MEQAGLANTRLGHRRDQLTMAALRQLRRMSQCRDFALATNKLGETPAG